MNTTPPSMKRLLLWAVLGGLLAGAFDIVFATGFWSLRGVPPQRIAQSVAAGLLGKASFSGGVATTMLGLALHFTIATAMSLAFACASRWLPRLVARPWRNGALYGVFLYALMTAVVVPLSAAPPRNGSPPATWLVASVIAHVALVGWPCAWFARRGLWGRWRRPTASADVGARLAQTP